jgi:sialate O-acetylesterase
MLGEWRRIFEDPKLPFYFVQLASFLKPNDNPADVGWGAIRDAQRRCLAIPHTGMASAVDVGDADDIHPKNKADVGERLALWALAGPYGKSGVVASGPLFEKLAIDGGKARISFTHTGGGLMVARKSGRAPAVEDKSAKVRRFAICGADKKWVWADAVIDGETVVVSSPEVAEPVAVRYAFGSNPDGANLYNRAGLPASPFSAAR